MISDIEEYFAKGCGRCVRFDTPQCSTKKWAGGLAGLRQICREVGLTETVKWGHPCYMRGDRNIALLGAFRDDFRITFFHAGLLKDSAGLLTKPGPNAQLPSVIHFSAIADVAKLEPVLLSYLQEAISYADQGLKPKKQQAVFELPDELVEAMDADPELAQAFHALTPGRQRSYVINLGSAKTTATRASRIVKFRAKVIASKGATER
jgi:uncharacterized protein YdeI (YjbR/CyaY-like superfamily)